MRRIAEEPGIQLKAFFGSDISTRKFTDVGFQREICWDTPLCEGYDHEFLPALGGRDSVSFWVPFIYGLRDRLRRGKFDAVWVHGYMRSSHIIAMATAKSLGLRVFVRDDATLIGRPRGRVRLVAKEAFFQLLAKLVDGFLAVGTRNKEYYLNYGIENARVFSMPWAVDNQYFRSRAQAATIDREKFRAELGLAINRPVILYVGKLLPRKRPKDLLDAWMQLYPELTHKTPYLLFVGDGELRVELEKLASTIEGGSIRFIGFKNQSELPAYYDLCDVFVMPTVFEPWGLVVNEVMNAGKAVIASDEVGCVPDLIFGGHNGFVYRARDIIALKETIRLALANPLQLIAMGRRSLEIIDRWSFEEDVSGLRRAIGAV